MLEDGGLTFFEDITLHLLGLRLPSRILRGAAQTLIDTVHIHSYTQSTYTHTQSTYTHTHSPHTLIHTVHRYISKRLIHNSFLMLKLMNLSAYIWSVFNFILALPTPEYISPGVVDWSKSEGGYSVCLHQLRE